MIATTNQLKIVQIGAWRAVAEVLANGDLVLDLAEFAPRAGLDATTFERAMKPHGIEVLHFAEVDAVRRGVRASQLAAFAERPSVTGPGEVVEMHRAMRLGSRPSVVTR